MPHLPTLRHTIASHLGAVLTPERAADIERAAFFQPDEAHNPAKFGVLHKDGFSFQVERLDAVLPELHALHEAHWLETEKHRHGFKLDPDYHAMLVDECAGRLIQFTVRRDGVLVGNLRMYLGESRHTRTLFAEEDTLYISPEARGSTAAMTLLRFAEASLVAIGVQEIRADSKLVNKADVLMRRMKYQPVATKFVKVFKESGDVQ